MVIGIFGGTFDPPHEGHVHIARKLKNFLQLTEVWWVVTNRNFLKQSSKYNLKERKELVRKVVKKHKGMRLVSLDSSYGCKIVECLRRRHQHVKFIWIAGSDVMENIHRWYRWRTFFEMIPVIIMERRGYVYNILRKPAAVSVMRISSPNCRSVKEVRKGWGIIRERTCDMSSTKIREGANFEI